MLSVLISMIVFVYFMSLYFDSNQIKVYKLDDLFSLFCYRWPLKTRIVVQRICSRSKYLLTTQQRVLSKFDAGTFWCSMINFCCIKFINAEVLQVFELQISPLKYSSSSKYSHNTQKKKKTLILITYVLQATGQSLLQHWIVWIVSSVAHSISFAIKRHFRMSDGSYPSQVSLLNAQPLQKFFFCNPVAPR